MFLTDAERNRFADWLEFDAAQSNAMAKQMDTFATQPGGGAHYAVLAKRERAEAMAALIIAKKLRSTESVTIGGQG